MKKFLILLAAAFSLCPMLWTQEAEPIPDASGDAQTVYTIRNLDFDFNGRTRPFAIIYNGEFKEGERLLGKAALDRYIARKTQALLNQRVLESASIEYALGNPDADGAIPVDLLIHVKDTWNIIALPYPQYDSNDGFKFIIKARDYNFFGTMSALRVDFGYERDNDDNNTFSFSIDSDIPFRAGGFDWSINFDHDFSYTVGEPLYYRNVTGISMELPFKSTTFTFGFNEYIIFNEENSDSVKDRYGITEDYFDGPYASSEVFTSWRIPLGVEVGEWGALTYTPRLAAKISYTKGGVDEPRRPTVTFSHSVGFGRVNWIGNYREGLEASISNSNSFFIVPNDWSSSLTANTTYYHTFGKLLGISAKLEYRQWFNDVLYDAGGALRGIINNRIRAENMLSFNIDFPFRLIHFTPSEWYSNRKLRLIDFDLHFSPFFDMALFKGPYNRFKDIPEEGSGFNFKDALYTAGVEVIVFPAFMRSLYLRASVGYNLKKIIQTGDIPKWDEIFIGMGHHY
ncbi:hypothetical protein [Leadbettera azotonutricia]|uniref:Bacterial surface antigen (D15) domain-containing protein n=1 Tax=Leadbettera azotonutricia (strain ATCC BAA-888 / DSM 13862 / ZAS-9) TaxID=545695 RepID=F5YAW3_LEAAZ|nr:hypothetical protein [Leadbettera azotonutricia]AEF82663.1 conserved hypothetical protein [Leadbettera azotonutricia ZAS-9]